MFSTIYEPRSQGSIITINDKCTIVILLEVKPPQIGFLSLKVCYDFYVGMIRYSWPGGWKKCYVISNHARLLGRWEYPAIKLLFLKKVISGSVPIL